MRVHYRILTGLALVTALTAAPARAQVDESEVMVPVEGEEMPVSGFYDTLSPYGEWIEVGGLGRVWRPYSDEVGADFRPYATGGHWVYTDVGWTFVSTYSWGWAPFHYGHWWFDASYGWVWLPGTRWAPAWVEWRYGGGYVGWAPVPPPGFQFGFVAHWGSPWCFVETRYISTPRITTYVVPVTRVRTVYTVTQSAPVSRGYGRTYYSAGPPASHVTSVTGTPVRSVPVRRVTGTAPTRVAPVRSSESTGPVNRPHAEPLRVERPQEGRGQPERRVGGFEERRNEVRTEPARPTFDRRGPEMARPAPTRPMQVPRVDVSRRGGFEQRPQIQMQQRPAMNVPVNRPSVSAHPSMPQNSNGGRGHFGGRHR